MELEYDLIIIGSGPAGLAAAKTAKENGISKILIIEREKELGGTLKNSVYKDFEIYKSDEKLTCAEYIQKYINEINILGIEYMTDCTAVSLEVSPDDHSSKFIYTISEKGYRVYETKAVILATGCYEHMRSEIAVPVDKPSGVFTAGQIQTNVDIIGKVAGKKVVICGSGNPGLILARKLAAEGAFVKAIIESLPYSVGSDENIALCTEKLNIPLLLSHTILKINGKNCVNSVTVKKTGVQFSEIEREIACDMLLISAELLPDNFLVKKTGIRLDHKTKGAIVNEKMETDIKGLFICGNALHIHDTVGSIKNEAETAAQNAVNYLKARNKPYDYSIIRIKAGKGLTYVIPQNFNTNSNDKFLSLFFRVNNIYKGTKIYVECQNKKIAEFKRNQLHPQELEYITIPMDYIKSDLIISIEENNL